VVPARLLDLTRLVSRLGRGPLTGVDRVELAYLTHLLKDDVALFALVRTAAGYLLLDREGARGVAALADCVALGPADLLSRLTNRRDLHRARAETAVRRLAVARSLHLGLGRLVRRVPRGASYLNVGHANLSDRALACLHGRFAVSVLVHDTIPLDHPALARPDTVAPFARKIAAVATHADRVIHLTEDARRRTEAHLARAGRCPPGVTAPLGVPQPKPGALPDGVQSPFYLTLGTIEPRKNHALLIDVWTRLAETAPPPRLYVAGGRGWIAPDLFDRLAATPGLTILSGLDDGAVAALLQGAQALLCPTLAEGFGLPPVEAAALGTPVIASDLPVLREVMGDYAVYLDPTDSYSWAETIRAQMRGGAGGLRQTSRPPPRWEDHFKTVLNLA